MMKTWLIIQREFLSRIKKRSFLIVSVLVPLLLTGFMFFTHWVNTIGEDQEKIIAVYDESNVFKGLLQETDLIHFVYPEAGSVKELTRNFRQSPYHGILFIPKNISYQPRVILYTDKEASMMTKLYIQQNVEKVLNDLKLLKLNVPPDVLKSSKSDLELATAIIDREGNNKLSDFNLARQATAITFGMFMYVFIMMFGVTVMKGIFEEKSNRVVEILATSVKPFQLMMGKIIGIGLTGILQLAINLVLTLLFFLGAAKLFFPEILQSPLDQVMVQDILNSNSGQTLPDNMNTPVFGNLQGVFSIMNDINLGVMLWSFLVMFLGGYMLYASLYAAVGSAIDHDTDTQQFVIPITLPLLFGGFVMFLTAFNPSHPLGTFFSYFPFTSPMVMMARVAYGVKIWEFVLSIVILAGTFFLTTWMAGRIYRTGILMYGKRTSYREIWKWLKHKY